MTGNQGSPQRAQASGTTSSAARPLGQFVQDPKHGPLPALLVLMTVITGVVDAVSILSLGRVFVANMTGNVVFVGLALAGAPGFSLAASLFALGGFLIGAFAGGVAISHLRRDRAQLLRDGSVTELILLAAALAWAEAAGAPFGNAARDGIAALAAVALGLQNAVVRELAVPDLTTTVLTMTITGIAADLRSRNTAVVIRRLTALASMLLGAAVGAVLVLHSSPGAALSLAVGLMAVVAAGAAIVERRPGAWKVPAPR
jgi:uncharacterized membrane protein YoaK (UPF0700 family)